ncbi:MAG: hypothetical protein J5I50_04040 [Chitinophagaceae bacterium]|nr:hypothetical protein [Chitinophagaceae bacterium]
MAKAIDTFNKTITRSNGLLTMYEKAHGNPDFDGLNKTDLIRSALVLAVSGMDSFFTSRFTENLVGFIKNKGATKSLIEILEKAGLNTEQSLEMLTMDRPYRRIRTLVDQYLSDYTTQRFDVIDKLFLVYGIKDLTQNAQGISGRKNLKKSIQKTVKRRHEIAHAADYNAHDKLKEIDLERVRKQIAEIKLFVESCEKLIVKILK